MTDITKYNRTCGSTIPVSLATASVEPADPAATTVMVTATVERKTRDAHMISLPSLPSSSSESESGAAGVLASEVVANQKAEKASSTASTNNNNNNNNNNNPVDTVTTAKVEEKLERPTTTTGEATIRTTIPEDGEDPDGTDREGGVEQCVWAPAESEHETVLRLDPGARAYTLREETSEDRRRMEIQLTPPLLAAPPLVSVQNHGWRIHRSIPNRMPT